MSESNFINDSSLQSFPLPLKRLQMSTTNRPLDVIRHWRNEGLLMLNPPYQRGDVWGATRRVNLIRSILLGIPIPSIVINDRMNANWGDDEYSYAVIDGKQRCQTVLMFMDNQLAIPGEWVGMNGDVLFGDLRLPKQRSIKSHPLGFCEGSLKNLEQEFKVFELINFGGVPQGESE